MQHLLEHEGTPGCHVCVWTMRIRFIRYKHAEDCRAWGQAGTVIVHACRRQALNPMISMRSGWVCLPKMRAQCVICMASFVCLCGRRYVYGWIFGRRHV